MLKQVVLGTVLAFSGSMLANEAAHKTPEATAETKPEAAAEAKPAAGKKVAKHHTKKPHKKKEAAKAE